MSVCEYVCTVICVVYTEVQIICTSCLHKCTVVQHICTQIYIYKSAMCVFVVSVMSVYE
jgi:hypothetical protein